MVTSVSKKFVVNALVYYLKSVLLLCSIQIFMRQTLVWQVRQQALRVYCPDIYCVFNATAVMPHGHLLKQFCLKLFHGNEIFLRKLE